MNHHSQQLPLLGASTYEANSSDDYYTPSEVFETMQLRFDLDVASPPGGIAWIPADRYFTMFDDALTQQWHGRVWMNPPYSNPGPFVDRWLEHGNGCALVPMAKSRWFQRLWASDASLAITHDIHFRFVREGTRKGISYTVCFAAIGPLDNHEAIKRLGRVR